MTRALIWDDNTKVLIAALKAKAAAHPTSLKEVKKLSGARMRTGIVENPLNNDFTIALPVGFRVTYTHEQQPIGLCQHISISVDSDPSRGPHPAAVDQILDLFGFRTRTDKPYGALWLDRGERLIVNVVEPVEGSNVK